MAVAQEKLLLQVAEDHDSAQVVMPCVEGMEDRDLELLKQHPSAYS